MVFASPKGGESPLDPSSVELFKEDEESQKFLKEEEKIWKSTEKLDKFVGKAKEFDGLFVPGGHGRMFERITVFDARLTNTSNVRLGYRHNLTADYQRVLRGW